MKKIRSIGEFTSDMDHFRPPQVVSVMKSFKEEMRKLNPSLENIAIDNIREQMFPQCRTQSATELCTVLSPVRKSFSKINVVSDSKENQENAFPLQTVESSDHTTKKRPLQSIDNILSSSMSQTKPSPMETRKIFVAKKVSYSDALTSQVDHHLQVMKNPESNSVEMLKALAFMKRLLDRPVMVELFQKHDVISQLIQLSLAPHTQLIHLEVVLQNLLFCMTSHTLEPAFLAATTKVVQESLLVRLLDLIRSGSVPIQTLCVCMLNKIKQCSPASTKGIVAHCPTAEIIRFVAQFSGHDKVLLQAMYLLKTVANCANITLSASSALHVYAILLKVMRSPNLLLSNIACEVLCYTMHYEKREFDDQKTEFFMRPDGIVHTVLQNLKTASDENILYSSICAVSLLVDKLPFEQVRGLLLHDGLLGALTQHMQHVFMNHNVYTYPKLVMVCKSLYKLAGRKQGGSDGSAAREGDSLLAVDGFVLQLLQEYSEDSANPALKEYAEKALKALSAAETRK